MIVHGRVQGVGFRLAVARAARTRGVAGWVRNRPDGTVEAQFEGDEEAVASLVGFCRDGPRGAEVTHLEERAAEAGGSSRFDVR